ncbi:low molecular weight phosphatase family protein [Haladaptatus sp. F3-133]|uniref:Low molecular weight phosphatase family protein n=1 Tax=Halorutilus salinus TaxID=2487751 RepID=A0A9Q4C120_9EURY|nr:low molecular weight phosphatase family protein [Halorutilus salinus]MCX2817992.1 low molecular weight phosphatase family protein [Halorutilus salinus]
MTTVAFVCVRNAGRSQMATAFAEREAEERGVDLDVITGGTRPADEVHEIVAEVMAESGFDLRDRTPREITAGELAEANIVVTMGCEASDVCPATFTGDNRDWDLDDPGGATRDEAREIRDEVERRIGAMFDELDERN